MRLGRHGLGAFTRRMRSAVEERSHVMVKPDDGVWDSQIKDWMQNIFFSITAARNLQPT